MVGDLQQKGSADRDSFLKHIGRNLCKSEETGTSRGNPKNKERKSEQIGCPLSGDPLKLGLRLGDWGDYCLLNPVGSSPMSWMLGGKANVWPSGLMWLPLEKRVSLYPMLFSLPQRLPSSKSHLSKHFYVERKQKGGCGFGECTFAPDFGAGEHPNVPSFRFLVPGNIRQSHPLGNHPFPNPRLGGSGNQDLSPRTAWHIVCPSSPEAICLEK